jgi:hypothetical protein
MFEEEDLPKDCPKCDAGYWNLECGCDECHYPILEEE